MELKNASALANTRAKFSRLEGHHQQAEVEVGGDEELREAELESLRRFINQLKEEIARFEAHQPA